MTQMLLSFRLRVMPQKDDEPKTLKQILATDYHIPGIRPRFYLPVGLLAFVTVVAYIIVSPSVVIPMDWLFMPGLAVVLLVSVISTTLQRLFKYMRRR